MNEQAWEEAALYRALRAGEAEQVFDRIKPADFTPGAHLDLAQIVHRCRAHQDVATASMAECQRVGNDRARDLLVSVIAGGSAYVGSGLYYANGIAENASRRRAAAFIARFEQRLATIPGEELWSFLEQAKADIDDIDPPHGTLEDDSFDLGYFMDLPEEAQRFTMPGMLKANERWLMIGKEGGGKSALVYQLLTGAAYGVDTLSHDYAHYDPQRVLFLDVENSDHQVAWNVKAVVKTLQEMRPEVQPYWKSLKRRVVDLTEPSQAVNVIRSAVAHAPDVLYMGTAYKLAFSEDYRTMGRAIMSTIDRIRAEVGCSVIVEHHAGWGSTNDRNNWRADGTSEWARWPDFARGMDVKFDREKRVMKLMTTSRLDRSTGRRWPVGLVQHNVFPWAPIFDQDEFDHLYGRLFEDEQQQGKRR